MSGELLEAFDELRKELEKHNLDTGIIHRYVAIPVPSLAVQYLLGYQGFPLSCFVQIVGAKASYKSMLALEIARWHLNNDGGAIYIDTEGGASKIAEHVLNKNSFIVSCGTMEAWMTTLTKSIQKVIKLIETSKRHMPVCFIVDSISGVTSQKVVEETEAEGFYVPNYPVDAKTLSTYFKQKSNMLNKAPFTILATNHIKEALNSYYGGPAEYIPGGKLLTYITNLQLRVSKKGVPVLASDSENEFIGEVEIVTDHNRLANEGRGISVPIRFTFISDGNGGHYELSFDWYAATTRLLTEAPGHKTKIREQLLKRIQKTINVTPKNAGRYGTYYYCEEWGLSKNDAVNETEFGKFIESHPEKSRLYETLMIAKATFYDPEKPYPPTDT